VLSEPTPTTKILAFNLSQNRAIDEQETMNKSCMGVPMKDYPPKNRGLCDYCRKHTQQVGIVLVVINGFVWKGRLQMKQKKKDLLIFTITKSKEKSVISSRLVCYLHKKHKAAWTSNETM
jgi:hypothetical protein